MSYQPPFNPSDEYVARQQMKATSYDINCHRVGRIVKFYPETMTCDVQVLEVQPNIMEGSTRFPQLNDLPLVINGANDSWITFGDITGSECLIHFNDRDIDNWFETGEEYLPNTNRLHNLSDGFVEISPRSKPNVINYDNSNLHIHKGSCDIIVSDDTVEIKNGSCIFSMSGDTITITGNIVVSGDITANGTITGMTDVIATGISGNSHTHGGVSNGQGNTGAPQ